MKQLINVFCTVLLATAGAVAQDQHFTQYLATPMLLNPALTGLVQQDYRFAATYRQEWGAYGPDPNMTGVFSFDIGTMKKRLPVGDAFGIGVVGLSNRSGSGAVVTTTGGLSLAYHKTLGRDVSRHLSVGVQGMWVNKNIEYSRLTSADLYSPTYPPPAVMPSLVAVSYPELNAGVMYSEKLGKRGMGYIGYSCYHLTEPVEVPDFFDSVQVHFRHTAYIGGSYYLNWNTLLYANALYREQAGAQDLILGASAGFVLNPSQTYWRRKTGLHVGGWYRYQESVAPYVSIDRGGVRLGLSYDINVSPFAAAAAKKGGFELSLTFNGGSGNNGGIPKNWSGLKLY